MMVSSNSISIWTNIHLKSKLWTRQQMFTNTNNLRSHPCTNNPEITFPTSTLLSVLKKRTKFWRETMCKTTGSLLQLWRHNISNLRVTTLTNWSRKTSQSNKFVILIVWSVQVSNSDKFTRITFKSRPFWVKKKSMRAFLKMKSTQRLAWSRVNMMILT